MDIQLMPDEQEQIDSMLLSFIERSENQGAELQQLAFDATQILGNTEERWNKQKEMGGIKRFWHKVSGGASRDNASNTDDMIQVQKFAFRFLQILQERQLMLAHTMLAVKNNLAELAVEQKETKAAIVEMAKRISRRFNQLEQRAEKLEISDSIQTWLLTIEEEDYLLDFPPRIRFLTVLKQFYTQKNMDWNMGELKMFRSALRRVKLDHKETIKLSVFVSELIEELQNQELLECYNDLLYLTDEQDQEIGMDFLMENVSIPGLLALKQLPESFERLQPAIEVLQENLEIEPIQAMCKVVDKDIRRTFFIDLDQQVGLFELGVQLLSGFALSRELSSDMTGSTSMDDPADTAGTPLSREDEERLSEWLEENDFIDIHTPNDDGNYPLLAAINEEDWSMAKLLLKKGADPNDGSDIDGTEMLPLHMVLSMGLRDENAFNATVMQAMIDLVKLLLESGADPNATVEFDEIDEFDEIEMPPLHIILLMGLSDENALNATVIQAMIDLTTLLLDSGADPNATVEFDEIEMSPLHIILSKGFSDEDALNTTVMQAIIDLVKLLLESGADPNATVEFDGMEMSPLRIILSMGLSDENALNATVMQMMIDLAKLLLESGADPNATVVFDEFDGIEMPPLHMILSMGLSDENALTTTVMQAIIDRTKLLLESGADPNATVELDEVEMPPLFMILARGFSDYDALNATVMQAMIDLVKILLESGADPNARAESDEVEMPPLHMILAGGFSDSDALNATVMQAMIDLVKILLESGADPNARVELDEVETPPLFMILAGGFSDENALNATVTRLMINLAKLLLESGADPNARVVDYDGEEISLLDQCTNNKLKKLLIQHGAEQ